MIRAYNEGELDPSEYQGVVQELIESNGGFVVIEGMAKSDFELLESVFSVQLDNNIIKTMTWIPIRGEFSAVV